MSELGMRRPLPDRMGQALLVIGVAWLVLDLQGPKFDVFHNLGLVQKSGAEYTIGLACSFALVMYGLPYAKGAGAWLDLYPFRFLGVTSYSIFVIHPFYIYMCYPPLELQQISLQTEIWKTWPVMPTWFFLLLYAPGLLFWSTLSFLAIEKPALQFGRDWVRQSRGGTGHRPTREQPADTRAAPAYDLDTAAGFAEDEQASYQSGPGREKKLPDKPKDDD